MIMIIRKKVPYKQATKEEKKKEVPNKTNNPRGEEEKEEGKLTR